MKIVMFTNTYKPHVGGVARSVETLEEMLESQGHQVYIIAPEFPEAEESDYKVFRVPAMQNFNGSDFSVCFGVPEVLPRIIDAIKPDIVHSHHPFLLGDAALRVARERGLPIVFTHHTMYEHYTHYVPLDSDALKRLAVQLSTDYCNLCDAVIAPSESIERLLRKRGVETQLACIPTGIDTKAFALGRRERFRNRFGISEATFVAGHVGRLAEEKNLEYLSDALVLVLTKHSDMKFVVVGDGAYRSEMEERMNRVSDQVVFTGKMTGQDLADAYASMDLFVMASQSETQGMVVAEAMAAGNPVVALDGPGIREIVDSDSNGRLLPSGASESEFADTISSLSKDHETLKRFRLGAQKSAADFDNHRCAAKVSALYNSLLKARTNGAHHDFSQWDGLLAKIEVEWDLFVEKIHALGATMAETQATEAKLD